MFPYEYNEQPRNSPFPEPRDTRTLPLTALVEDAMRLALGLARDDPAPPDEWKRHLAKGHRLLVAALTEFQACK